MGTTEQLVSWRTVDRAEQQAAHFEGLLTLRREQARAAWIRQLAELERWRDLESQRMLEASDKLTRVQGRLTRERAWRRDRRTQRLPVSVLLCSWRTMLIFCWWWVLLSARSLEGVLASQLPVAAMWFAVFLTRRR